MIFIDISLYVLILNNPSRFYKYKKNKVLLKKIIIKHYFDIVCNGKTLFFLFFFFFIFYISLCVQGEIFLKNNIKIISKQIEKEGFIISYNASSSYKLLTSELNLDNVVITAPRTMGSWILKSSRLTVNTTPFSSRTISIKINGTHSLSTIKNKDIRLVVEDGEIIIHSDSSDIPFFLNVFLKNIQAASPQSMKDFLISEISFKLFAKDLSSLTFSISSETIFLPEYLKRKLPEKIDYFLLKGTVKELNYKKESSLICNIIKNKGKFEITQGELFFFPLMSGFSGTFTVNKNFEISAMGTATTYGLFDFLEILQENNCIRQSQLSMAKVVLGQKIKQKRGEKYPSLTFDFSFQSGKFYADRILLYDRQD